MKARFAAVRVRVADGPPQRIGDKGMQHMPGEEVWLVGGRRASGEQKYYLANLPADADLKTLAATIKARWVCEQAHQQLKEELGLDHFEGRSWRGLHRHALMAMIAYAFLQHLRLAAASGGKKNLRRPASADAPGHPKSRRRRPGPRSKRFPGPLFVNRRRGALAHAAERLEAALRRANPGLTGDPVSEAPRGQMILRAISMTMRVMRPPSRTSER